MTLTLMKLEENTLYQLNQSNTNKNKEMVSFQSFKNQTLYLLVTGDNNGEYYDLDLVIQEKPPQDDFAEDNDIMSNSYYLTPNWYSGLIHNDDDWFSVYSSASKNLTFSMHFDTQKDLYFAIYNSTSDLIGQGQPTSFGLTFHYITPSSDDYYFRIHGFDTDVSYDIDITVESPEDDWAEENDVRSEAYYIGSLGTANMLLSWDDDWFGHYELNESDEMNASLNYDTNLGSGLNIELVDGSGDVLVSSFSNGKDEVSYHHFPNSSINVYVRIFGDNIGLPYEMYVGIQNKPTDDSMENNDDQTSATEIDIPLTEYGLIQKDDDWYKFYLLQDEEVECKIFGDNQVPLFMDLYDGTGSFKKGVTKSIGDDGDSFYYQAPSSGWYYLFIAGDNAGDWYDLEIDYSYSSGDDWMEDNDNLYGAYPLNLPINEYDLVQNDEDWYEVSLNQNEELQIRLAGNEWFRVEIHDSYGRQDYFEKSSSEYEKWYYYTAPTSQDYYIYVSGDFNGDLYDLEVNVGGEYTGGDDWAEENDIRDEAWNLGDLAEGNITKIGLTQKDQDWFSLWIPEGTNISLFFSGESTYYMDIDIYNSAGRTITHLEKPINNQEITFEYSFEYDDTYFIKVDGDSNGGWYDLEIQNVELSTDYSSQDGTKDNGSTNNNNNDFSPEEVFGEIPGFPIEITGLFLGLGIIFIIWNYKRKN